MELKKVVIPEGCERIGNCAFMDCKNLEEVVIPKSVKWIGSFAFYDCTKAVVILEKPEKKFEFIGCHSFWNCSEVNEKNEEKKDRRIGSIIITILSIISLLTTLIYNT